MELRYFSHTIQRQRTLFLFVFVSIVTAHKMTYNEGRLNGAPPSVDYLRKYSYLIWDSPVDLPYRARWGSSNYTNLTYMDGVENGNIYWAGAKFKWKLLENADMPTICTNLYRLRPTGERLGYFICPSLDKIESEIFCCGNPNNETCCDFETAQIFYYTLPSPKEYFYNNGGVVFAVVLVVFFPFAVVFFCTECFKASRESYRFNDQK